MLSYGGAPAPKPEEEQGPDLGVQKPAQAPQPTTTYDNMKSAGASAPQDLGQWANYQQGHDAAHTQVTTPGATTQVGASANNNQPRTTGAAGGFGMNPVDPQAQQWHPTQQQMPGFQGPLPQMPTAQAQAARMPSVEEVGLHGGDPQSVQNLMRALQMVGAGGNNQAQQALGGPAQQAQGPLLGAPAAWTGSQGPVGYYGGFGGPAQGSPTGGGTGSRLGNAIAPGGGSSLPGSPYTAGGGGLPQGLSGTYQGGPPGGFGSGGYQPPVTALGQLGQPTNAEEVPQALRGAIMSDATAKHDVRPASDKLSHLLDELGAHEYSYKDPRDGEGRFFGPMAQELERSEVGRTAVVETPRGKMIHPGRAAMIALSAAADIQQRLKKAGL